MQKGYRAQDADPALLDLAAFEATPLQSEPFDHLVVPDFIPAAARGAIESDFPVIEKGGSFPVEHLTIGPRCAALIAALSKTR